MPRGGHMNPTRQEIYDRAPTGIPLNYSAAGVAPHVKTQRFTVTIAALNRGMFQGGMAQILRVTAAGTPGKQDAAVELTLSGTVFKPVSVQMLTNGVGDTQHEVSSATVLMAAGDIAAGFTTDAAVTGTVDYTLEAMVVQFSQ